ncbi:hypothetical protein Mgra_00009796 [Meloidogyne graminicola]|uniref:Uncharacterized protein n=1 Tax=Meloidogyne graminicola TaxID=189291 RepID=A0A8S9ZD83_9BILA|nr:hypothetical protein Mgra_00009796 [Meloidogyne graminicola]
MVAFFSVLFLPSIQVILPFLVLPFLTITMILFCAKKVKFFKSILVNILIFRRRMLMQPMQQL